jgi:hypothetical protein
MIEFGPYLVVSTFDLQGTEDYFNSYLYWIDTATLEIMETMTGESFRNRSMLEMKLSPDSILHVLTIEEDSVYMLQFDDERNWVGTVPLPSHGFIPSANFVILDNGNMVYGLEGNSFLKCIDAEGTLLWQCDLASQFLPEHLDFVYEIETASNGDILVCGPSNEARAALIARISNSGQVLWARVHEVSIAKESFLFDIIETPDSGILYTGSVKMVEPAPTSAHDFYWMLKTNQLGCIDTTCLLLVDEDGDGYNSAVDCNDLDASINPGQPEIPNNQIDEDCDGSDLTTATNGAVSFSFKVMPNPTGHYLQILPGENIHSLQFTVTDISGQPVIQGLTNNMKIDVGFLQPGIYFLQLWEPNAHPVVTLKIVKSD